MRDLSEAAHGHLDDDGFVIILAAQALLAIVDRRQRRVGISAPSLPVLPRPR